MAARSLELAFERFTSETKKLKAAYETLREEFVSLRSQMQNILQNIHEGLLFIEANGTITLCNQAAYALLGIKNQDLVGRSVHEVFPDRYFGFSIKEARRNSQLSAIQLVRERQLAISTSITSEGGIVILLRDKTKEHHLARALQRQDRLKELGEMASRLAHEIRNPLGGIEGFAALLKRDLADRQESQKMCEAILEGTKGLNRLLHCILNYAKPFELNIQRCQLKELIICAAKLTRITTLTIDGPDFFEVFVDKELFISSMINLLKNAQQAGAKKTPVKVGYQLAKRHWSLYVEDIGCGIEEKNLEKIFSPFFTTKVEGSGLGLSEVHKIIEAHGGTISAKNTKEGARFTMKLPISYAD